MTAAVRRGLLAAGLLVQALLAVHALLQASATFDEPAHVVAGASYWATGDYRLNPEHPPLAKLLATAPLPAMGVRFDTDDEVWRLRRQWEMARRFLYRWNDADRVLLAARLPIVACGLLLSVLVYGWTRRLFGDAPALVALGACVFSPDVLAHSGLVTTDVPVATFFLATVMAAHHAASPRGAIRGTASALVLGLALGAALATKFSALLLLPILLVLAVVAATGPVDERRTPRQLARTALLAGAVALLVVWSAYGFRPHLSPDPAQRASLDWREVDPGPGPVPALLRAANAVRLLPEAYVYGCLRFLKHADGRPSFLHGQRSEEGFRAFFPVSFAIKTPLPLLVLLGMAGLAARRRPLLRRDAWFLWLPPLVYAAVSIASALNIGHRHLLPVYPFLFVAAGRVASLAPGGSTRAVVSALLLLLALGTGRTHPHHLAYFNELVGGPAGGWRWLVDSSLDWGQDLGRLGAWCRAHDVRTVKLAYFGTADPAHHGVPAVLIPGQSLPRPAAWVREVRPGDVVVVSATLLQGIYVEPGDQSLFTLLRTKTPVARVGHSLFVYRADFTWPGP